MYAKKEKIKTTCQEMHEKMDAKVVEIKATCQEMCVEIDAKNEAM